MSLPKPYRRLLIAIVVQSIKDYAYADQAEREDVLDWVTEQGEVFTYCAENLGLSTHVFYEIMKNKIKAIDEGEGIFVNTKRGERTRFLTHRVFS